MHPDGGAELHHADRFAMTVADAPEQVDRSLERVPALGPPSLIAVDDAQRPVGIGLPGGIGGRLEVSQAPDGHLPGFGHPPDLLEEYGVQLAGLGQALLVVEALEDGDRLLESRRGLRIPAEVPVGPGEITQGRREPGLVCCHPARLDHELIHLDPVL